ncbi:release factor glutamine methyltransferase [Devosia enhydra]|uniref:Release factor glutamine methyltransferase n=1 Tax=Devosia enhydra TaxID=665118 RepID=A0A1K2I078_9HYPH|nr:peptide chain release factor N(5)-glutamine methyltransferase [Devosia enhydra]SFZ85797.1 release factor glutamine methyltransferase [Devosia enhydra]
MRDRFRAAAIDTPELDARRLAEAAFGCTALALYTNEHEPADPDALARLEAFAQRRIAGEPVSRILGVKAFWGLDFLLSPETLVPRPETEMLVRRGLERLEGKARPRLLDLGTGTGCIAIALLHECPDAQAMAVDLSPGALETARENAARHGVADRLDLRLGSWFEPIALGERFDLVVSNPPYIADAERPALSVEVRDHDPHLALFGGPDGLEPYRIIAAELARHLKPGGLGLFEIGHSQGPTVRAILAAAGFSQIAVARDLEDRDRMVVVTAT